MMIQPKTDEITYRLKQVINNKMTREEVGKWALDLIRNDENVEVNDIDAWHYLVSVSSIDEMIGPNDHLYSIEDIKGWIENDRDR